jgi:hypothetical protein
MNGIRILIGAVTLALFALTGCAVDESMSPEAELPAAVDSPAGETQVAPSSDEQAAAGEEESEAEIVTVDEAGNTSVDSLVLASAVAPYPADGLSAEEAAGLFYMREEEKLAHDVYITLYEMWGLPIFQNIASSEQTHTDAVNTLIERYGLEDPANGNGVGVFTDPALQSLYDQLVEAGSTSLADALSVGAAVEEIDILDLERRLIQTDNRDITLVYDNLMKGSRNHLRSFVSTLERQTGDVYQPQYLDQASYDAIVSAGIERGGGGRGYGRGN